MANAVSSSQVDSDSFADRPITSALSGLFYAAIVITVSVCMLLVNALACLTIYSVIPPFAPKEIMDRIGQFFFFTAPLVLMLLEWNLVDRVGRIFTRTDA